MASGDPDLAVATAIGDALALWTLGTNLFDGPVRPPSPSGSPIPIKAVFCLASGGPEPRRTFGASQIDQPAVQIVMRWDDQDDHAGGKAAARAIRDAVDNAALGAGYIRSRVTHSEPHYLGIGPSSWPEWSINVEAMYLP